MNSNQQSTTLLVQSEKMSFGKDSLHDLWSEAELKKVYHHFGQQSRYHNYNIPYHEDDTIDHLNLYC